MKAERWGTGSKGRSTTVAHGDRIWTVSNARTLNCTFEEQVSETLGLLQESLRQASSDKSNLLSVQVILTDITNRDAFDELWCRWIGDNPDHWPQRAVFGAALAPGLLIEIIAVASCESKAKPSEA
jgi:enamine deaminase RidA (YjgF/YER057c/UK114 family)